MRTWLVLNSAVQALHLEAGKQTIMGRTGLPARDLRILNPFFSYPSTVLGRDRAIVVNLEHIKAIITAQEVFLLNSMDPSVKTFVGELQRRILCHPDVTEAQKDDDNLEGSSWTNVYDNGEPPARVYSLLNKIDANQSLENQDRSKVLPFEFVALEACLEAACCSLEHEASTLELEAHPALDKLASKISNLNLERVRQIKSQLVAISGRVQKVRDELEHVLDDDGDMAEMYLTEKVFQQLENSSKTSMSKNDAIDENSLESGMDDRFPADISLEGYRESVTYEGDLQSGNNAHDLLPSAQNAPSKISQGACFSMSRNLRRCWRHILCKSIAQ